MSDATAPRMLEQLEREARERNLLLRLQVGRPLGLWSLRLVVAQPNAAGRLLLQGEMKGWAYAANAGLQLDTMRVQPGAPAGVGDLIWAATMAWALETASCRQWDPELTQQSVMQAWMERAEAIRQWQLRLRHEPGETQLVTGLGSQRDWEQRCEAMLRA